jgi:hypothetical protein
MPKVLNILSRLFFHSALSFNPLIQERSTVRICSIKNCSASIIFLGKYNHIRNRKSAITTAQTTIDKRLKSNKVF